ncbi:hypothetical protein [Pseudomonas abietaniphila]|uniref:hypothetical protein n=2 Tax=Pseudomonas abietaniphila TaxID=89065 RepID=UPI00128C5CB2|nr:hypothetical protein [Pseudomonas abietaniphila]
MAKGLAARPVALVRLAQLGLFCLLASPPNDLGWRVALPPGPVGAPVGQVAEVAELGATAVAPLAVTAVTAD